ncbi:hypothetical protein KP509_18G050600 [Ceratopteris richardii]|uniref:Uncharacterized protein n=1 Tax=Ceratopteris richardii TaxID=49495 RepID=A0A8T2SU45_CERRI|nr:hypothetical protein KP509_18G050600 [Ceratopteris richardii]
MDRFQWLKCQPWLLLCSPAPAADSVHWFFEGFSSFCTCPLPLPEEEALSRNAAHLYFYVPPSHSSLDPAQLSLKLGTAEKAADNTFRDILFAFEETRDLFHLDFKQVLSLTKWTPQQGCEFCSSGCFATTPEQKHCACQLLPSYMTLRFKHVSMIIYCTSQSTSHFFSAMDVLCKAVEEGRQSDSYENKGSTCSISELPHSQSTLHGSSKEVRQKFFTTLNCMSECAISAVDVCNANFSSMAQMLHVLMLHTAEHKEYKVQSKSMLYELQYCLKNLEDERDAHLSNIWAASQHEAKASAIVTLQNLLEKVCLNEVYSSVSCLDSNA